MKAASVAGALRRDGTPRLRDQPYSLNADAPRQPDHEPAAPARWLEDAPEARISTTDVSEPRSLLAPALAVGTGSALLYLAWGLWQGSMWFMLDLDVYRAGGHAALTGSGLYDLRFTSVGLPFTYPPMAAAVFAPVSVLPDAAAKVLMIVATLAALGWVVWLTFGALGRVGANRLALSAAVAAACLWLEPIQQTLSFGQVNVLLMALVLGDVLRKDGARTKGIGVGIATGFKLTPGIFILYLLLTSRVRAAKVAIVTFLGTIAAGFLLLPHESKEFWGDRLFLDSKRVGGVGYVGNQSLHGLITRLGHGSTAADVWWTLIALVTFAVGMYVARRAYHRSGDLAGVLVCALTGLLISPISWSHHWVYVVPALALGVHLAIERHSAGLWTAIILLSAVFTAWPLRRSPNSPWVPEGVIWTMSATDNREFQWHGVELLVGNAEVLAGFLLLVAACVYYYRDVRTTAAA